MMILIPTNSKELRECQLVKLSSPMHTILVLEHGFIKIVKIPGNCKTRLSKMLGMNN
jgi:hypothetical protein